MLEYNETNNWVAVPITLTMQTNCPGGATTGAQQETQPTNQGIH